jgi:hypothetical protein
MSVLTDAAPASLKVNNIRVEIVDRGPALLFLHPDIGIDRAAPVLDASPNARA